MFLRRRWLIGSLAVILIAISVTFVWRLNQSVDDVDAPDTTDAMATEAVMEAPLVTEDPMATAEVEAPLQITHVAEAGINIAEGFSFSISRVERYAPDSPLGALDDPPTGTQWILVTVSILNESSSATVTIHPDDLVLITQTDERLMPLQNAEGIAPYLIGATLRSGESMYGFAVYAVPPTLDLVALGWCPVSTCSELLTAPIPTITNR